MTGWRTSRPFSLLRHFPRTLGKQDGISLRPAAAGEARTVVIRTEERRPLDPPICPHGREWLHRPPIPEKLRNDAKLKHD